MIIPTTPFYHKPSVRSWKKWPKKIKNFFFFSKAQKGDSPDVSIEHLLLTLELDSREIDFVGRWQMENFNSRISFWSAKIEFTRDVRGRDIDGFKVARLRITGKIWRCDTKYLWHNIWKSQAQRRKGEEKNINFDWDLSRTWYDKKELWDE